MDYDAQSDDSYSFFHDHYHDHDHDDATRFWESFPGSAGFDHLRLAEAPQSGSWEMFP